MSTSKSPSASLRPLRSSALLAVALALSLASRSGATSRDLNPAPVYLKLGEITAQVLSDGQFVFDELVCFRAPFEAVTDSYDLVHRKVKPGRFSINNVLLHLPGGKRVLVDAGAYNVPVPQMAAGGRLRANLAASGVALDSIDAVVVTHGHPDHVGGLVTDDGAAAFPNARVYISRVEDEVWGGEQPFENGSKDLDDGFAKIFSDVYRRSVKPYKDAGKLSLVEDGESPIDGITFNLTPGHAMGHAVIQVAPKEGGERLTFIGDAWYSQPDQLRHPEWQIIFDYDGHKGFLSRAALIKSLEKSGDYVIGSHETYPGIGHVVKTSHGYDWAAAPQEVLETSSTKPESCAA